jgi:DNA polymerase-3 subunit alpha
VKFDFLGLKTLTLIHDCLTLIKAARGVKVDIDRLPLDDKKTYKTLCQGNTTGVFQLESTGIREMTVRIRPNCFEDLVAILALYRPGPLDSGMAEDFINRKSGKEKIKYLHPLLETILKDTYGVIVYQEQVMQTAQILAGYSMGDADILRRAMGKKDPEEMAAQRERFVSGAVAKNIDGKRATEIFDQMETFARYGFNKSHSAAYALVSYQTAYLKTHYPVEFMAALLTSEMGDTDKVIKNLADCRDKDIEVLAPDVNESGANFTPVGDKIRFGLAGVKNVGEKAVEVILESRTKDGPFESLFDFCRRVDMTAVNRRVIESLIKCGAFDSTQVSRARMSGALDDAMKVGQAYQRDQASNQIDIFSVLGTPTKAAKKAGESYPAVTEWSQQEALAFEKEALGFYITGHPLDKYERTLKKITSGTVAALKERGQSGEFRLGGVVSALRLRNTKKGDRYGSFNLEDKTGFIEVIVWPESYKKCADLLGADDPIYVKGKMEVGEDRIQVIANEVTALADAVKNPKNTIASPAAEKVDLYVREDAVSAEELVRLRDMLLDYPGRHIVYLHLRTAATGETIIELPEQVRIAPSRELEALVDERFGMRVSFHSLNN